MVADDLRDGKDSGQSNFQVLADQKDEEDYAVNVFKGSGKMDEIMGKDKSQTKEQQLIEAKVKALMQKEKSKQNKEKEILELDPSAGDKQINSDAVAMYEFSNAMAK